MIVIILSDKLYKFSLRIEFYSTCVKSTEDVVLSIWLYGYWVNNFAQKDTKFYQSFFKA